MKNRNKRNVLDFNKESIVELNDWQVAQVNGGVSTLPCSVVTVAIGAIVAKMEISFDMEV